MTEVQAVILAAVVAALGGFATPALVRALPEPAARPDDELSEHERAEGPKEPYAVLAGLGWFAPTAMVVSGVAGGLVGWAVGWSWLLVGLVPLVPVVVALSVIDLRTRLLPSRIVLPTTAVMVALAVVHAGLVAEWSDLGRGLLALVVGRSFYWLLWFVHSAGMGFGDVRLAALLGLVLGYLGWPQFVVGMYAGFLVLAVPGVLLALVRRRASYLRAQYPFGPFMAVGALIGILVGERVLVGFV
ncbi:A24 family peptidase [Nocardioides sp. 1609]|uniref:prepilin peptidase n=1 Tax=Nocardioides sp. 1609 TaxID=2508327 RepID=UPI0014313849|nr:A24 family peptidase [Nocardioides sp. 1609]